MLQPTNLVRRCALSSLSTPEVSKKELHKTVIIIDEVLPSKRYIGDAVFNLAVGGLVAALFLGLPTAIIGLFVFSTLDRRQMKPPDSGIGSRDSAHSVLADEPSDRRRRVVYGRHSAATAAKQEEPERIRAQKV